MADVTGYLCEAIVKLALSKTNLDWVHHDTVRPQTFVDCLTTCSHSMRCRGHRQPKLRVEPDFVLYLSKPVFVYVTHADSSNILNFKLWRTLGEVVEQRKYIDDCYCVDILFGRIREKQEVYRGFPIISDQSWRIGVPDSFDTVKKVFETGYSGRMAVDLIVDWLQQNQTRAIRDLVAETTALVTAITQTLTPGHLAKQQQQAFRDLCSVAQWEKDVRAGDVGGHIRTGVILAAVLMQTVCRDSVSDLTRLLQGRTRGVPMVGPNYRKRGESLIPAWRINEQMDRDELELALEVREALQAFESVGSFVEFVALYRHSLERDPTWAVYLEAIGSAEKSQSQAERLLACWNNAQELGELLRKSFLGHEGPLMLEMMATVLDTSMNRLAQSLEDDFARRSQLSLKKFAPHGDDSIHVLSNLNRGRADQLKYTLMPRDAFLSWVVDQLETRWTSFANATRVKPRALELATRFQYRLLKTVLTRAPSPLIQSVREICESTLVKAGYTEVGNTLSRTYLNDLLGGKVLRAGVALSFEGASRTVSFLVSSTSEGHDLDKRKEYAAKIAAKKLRADASQNPAGISVRREELVVLVLDGTWPEDSQRFMYETGADLVVTFQTFGALREFLLSVIAGTALTN